MKVIIVVEGGCVVEVQSDQAACEVEVIDLDSQELSARAAARGRHEQVSEDPALKVVL